MAALIAWMLVVRVDDPVKDRRPPEAAALRAVLDRIINTNRMPSKRSRPLSRRSQFF
jgi:antitoxin component of RelBE/YafQ-DinJ toxin-antitoxin module